MNKMTPPGADAPRTTIASRVSRRLRAAILSGEIEPGAKVNLDRLRKDHDISVSSAREAIGRLVVDGLVEFEDQRGYRVTPISLENLEEVTFLRVRLEAIALRASIDRGDIEWETTVLASLHRLNRIRRVAGDLASIEAWEVAHQRFHAALIVGCGMPQLLSFCAILHNQNDRYRRRFLLQTSGDRNVAAEHAAIAEAAVARDADRAAMLLGEHIERTGSNLLARLRQEAEGGA